jgi:hypothetical protein
LSFKWSLSFGLSHQNPIHVSPLSHVIIIEYLLFHAYTYVIKI